MKSDIYAHPSVEGKKTAETPKLWLRRQRRKRSFGVRQENESAMIFTTRDLDILRFLRWCRFAEVNDLVNVFSMTEVQNLESLRLIKLYKPAKAYTLTAAGNRLLNIAFQVLPAAVAPAYKAPDTLRRTRQAKLMLTSYQAQVPVFTTDSAALCDPSMFLPTITRSRGFNPWGSTRVAALLHTGDYICAIHWVSPGIGCVALTDELTAFQNHVAAIPFRQHAFIFAASSYEDVLLELDALPDDNRFRLQSYREVYDCVTLPIFLLACNQTGVLQLRILSVPNYRELLAKIILKSHYIPPPINRPAYDAVYQGAPFVMAADMDLRRVDAAVAAAHSDGASQIILAALPEQVESVMSRRYRQTGKARVFTITEASLQELIGDTAPYTPPNQPFYTSEGGVLGVPPFKTP